MVFPSLERFFLWLNRSQRIKGDRTPKWLKMSRSKLLMFNVLSTLFFPLFCNAQKTNQLVFEGLVLKSVKQQGISIDSLGGFLTPNLKEGISLSSEAKTSLLIENPRITFQKIGDRMYARTVEAVLNFQDSLERGFSVVERDTVAAKALKMVCKTKIPELRGDNPRWISKYLAPALLIGTGIAGIISLFYLRS